MYIIGSAQTKFGINEDGLPDLMYEAVEKALEDSNLDLNQIKAFVVSNNLSYYTDRQSHISALLASIIGKDESLIFNNESACGSGGAALNKAISMLEKYDPILVLGVEKMSEHTSFNMLNYVATDSDRELEQKQGLIFPAAGALLADMYMRKYKITMDDLNLIAKKNHDNGCLNPYAQFYNKKVDMDKIKASPELCSPLRLFDFSPNSDGAAAVVISKKKKKNSVKIKSSKYSVSDIITFNKRNVFDFSQVSNLSQKALKESELNFQDIDIFELHDGFTIIELIAMESIGLFKPGKAKYAVRNGETQRQAKYPINTTGGLKACGHPLGASGIRQIHDLRRQLLGRAEKNQINKAKTGFALNFGAIFKSVSIHILESLN